MSQLRVKDLKPNPKNPRKCTDRKQTQLRKNLYEYGDLSGVVFNRKSGQLVGGHQRSKNFDSGAEVEIVKAYKTPTRTGTVAEGFIVSNGERFTYREVDWDGPKEKGANIAANAGAGIWDTELLQETLVDLSSFDVDYDLDLTMFDEDQLKEFGGVNVKEHTRVSSTGTDEDEVPEKAPPQAKLGEIYLLGQHRLMCGDSTDDKQVARLLRDVTPDLCFTSPPYNLGKFKPSGKKVNVPKREQKYLTVADDLSESDYEKFLIDFISIAIARCTSTMVNVGLMEANKRPVMRVVNHFLDQFKETLYWKKSNSTPHIQAGIVTSLVEPIFCFGQYASRCFRTANFKGNCPNVVEGPNAGGNEFADVHAATFPVYFPEWAIENFSQGAIYDPFGGSGTTLIACEKTNRPCFMMEIDPSYCDVIIARWEKYTGLKAKKVKTVLTRKAAKQVSEQVHGQA